MSSDGSGRGRTRPFTDRVGTVPMSGLLYKHIE